MLLIENSETSMNQNLTDWDEDLPPEPEEVYQDLLRALNRKAGFGLFFVQCTPGEADRLIAKIPQDIPQKKIATLRLVESIDNLYQLVGQFVKDKQVDILLIQGLEYSLYKYEQRTFGEIIEGQYSDLISVPPILNHLNQQRESFRDDFKICFVFILRAFSINYFIQRAPDFFDWRSGVFELITRPEVVEQETIRLLLEGDSEEYLKFSIEKKIEKFLDLQELITEKHQRDSNKTILLFKLGKLLVAANEYEGGIASYDQAVKIKPDYHEAWYKRGVVLGELGRYEEAIASFEQTLKIKPNLHEAWYIRSILLKELGRYEEAIESFEQTLKFKHNLHEAWYNMGILLRELGHNKEAIASYEQALKIQPDYHQAWYNLGIFFGELGRYEETIVFYDQALKIKPNFHQTWNYRGTGLRKLGRYEEAIISYDQALKIQPEYHQAWNNRGIALGDLGRYEEAIFSYDQALKIKPNLNQAWNNRGIALRKLGRYEEAIISYDQALKIQPDYYQAWNNRSIALDELVRYEKPIASFNKANKINPGYQTEGH
ncbi:TPR repeat-containing protein [Tolypothrix sp. NIES-4075]|nr:TPR repeat-containing protein [Tolypothrix sp. NIES-4075]